MIKIDFEIETEYGTFKDAIYLEENISYTTEEIDTMKQQRVDNWIAVITTPPPPQQAGVKTFDSSMG